MLGGKAVLSAGEIRFLIADNQIEVSQNQTIYIIKDNEYVCAVCDSELSLIWNL